MITLAIDENFNAKVVRGLQLCRPDLDIVGVAEAGIRGSADEAVLEWAAASGRVLLTHDRRTMPRCIKARVLAGEPFPGAIIVKPAPDYPMTEAIRRILEIVEELESADGGVRFIP